MDLTPEERMIMLSLLNEKEMFFLHQAAQYEKSLFGGDGVSSDLPVMYRTKAEKLTRLIAKLEAGQ